MNPLNTTKSLQLIRNVPQIVYALPLSKIPEVGLDTAISTVFSRLIIGPSRYPIELGNAFQQLLEEAGVPNADEKIWNSDIPWRR
jgi:hypothetical protein